MVVMGLMLRVLEAPLFLKLVRSKGNTVAYRSFCISAFALVEVVSIAWYTAAGPDLVFAFDARVYWWVALIGWAIFMIGGVMLAVVGGIVRGLSVEEALVLILLVLGVGLTSLFLWLLGPLSATGLMGCLVMVLTGTLPAVLCAARKS
jgi:hypothetical protein